MRGVKLWSNTFFSCARSAGEIFPDGAPNYHKEKRFDRSLRMCDMLQLVAESGKAQCALLTNGPLIEFVPGFFDKLKHIEHLHA